jgi:spermidine synthase
MCGNKFQSRYTGRMQPDHLPDRPAPLVRTENGRRTLEFAAGDIQSTLLLARPDALVLDYTRAMMAFVLFAPLPRRIVMVGLGGGSLARFCHRHFPACDITVLEVRADVIALRDAFLVPRDDARFRVVHADAAAWFGASPAPADVILLDGFDAAGLPPALASDTFYRHCRRALRPGGVLVANVFTYDPAHDAILAALAGRFDDRICWFVGAAGDNRIVFACADAAHAGLPAWLLRRRAIGWCWLNRIGMRLLVAWLGRRSVRDKPQHATSGSTR